MITIRPDVICPIACGSCCYKCKHLSSSGCLIERRFRPYECNAWLCSDGTIACNSFVDLHENVI